MNNFTLWLVRFGIFYLSLSPAFSQDGRPTFVVIEGEKPSNCPGGGFHLVEGYVKAADNDAFVDVDIFFQKYDGSWERGNFTRKGSGRLKINKTSCDYTGNYYAFAYYSQSKISRPTINDVKKRHAQMGTTPKFRMTKKSRPEQCEQGGVHFEEGEVFTPNGERVRITLFMEKNDGSWRKKDYRFVGSGFMKVNIIDCNLTGNYKSRVAIGN